MNVFRVRPTKERGDVRRDRAAGAWEERSRVYRNFSRRQPPPAAASRRPRQSLTWECVSQADYTPSILSQHHFLQIGAYSHQWRTSLIKLTFRALRDNRLQVDRQHPKVGAAHYAMSVNFNADF
jgi:hypothetical protein